MYMAEGCQLEKCFLLVKTHRIIISYCNLINVCFEIVQLSWMPIDKIG